MDGGIDKFRNFEDILGGEGSQEVSSGFCCLELEFAESSPTKITRPS